MRPIMVRIISIVMPTKIAFIIVTREFELPFISFKFTKALHFGFKRDCRAFEAVGLEAISRTKPLAFVGGALARILANSHSP
jgi:hypothetical protein